MADTREIVAGCRMASDRGISQIDKATEIAAKQGCDALLARILAYYRRHHADAGEAAHG